MNETGKKKRSPSERLRSARKYLLLTTAGVVIALWIVTGIKNYDDRNAMFFPGLMAFLIAGFVIPIVIGLAFGVWDGLSERKISAEDVSGSDAKNSSMIIFMVLRSILYTAAALLFHSLTAAVILTYTSADRSDLGGQIGPMMALSLAVGGISFAVGDILTRVIRLIVRKVRKN